MNRDDIIRMAREAGAKPGTEHSAILDALDMLMLAALHAGAAAEREACAKLVEEYWEIDGTQTAKEFAAVIRAMG